MVHVNEEGDSDVNSEEEQGESEESAVSDDEEAASSDASPTPTSVLAANSASSSSPTSSTSTTTAPPIQDTEQPPQPSVAERAQQILDGLPRWPSSGQDMGNQIYLQGLIHDPPPPDEEAGVHRHMNSQFPAFPQVDVGPAPMSIEEIIDAREDSAVNSGVDERTESDEEDIRRRRRRARRTSGAEEEGEGEEHDRRVATPSTPPSTTTSPTSSTMAPSTTETEPPSHPSLADLPVRNAGGMNDVPRSFTVMQSLLARMRAGIGPPWNILSTPDEMSFQKRESEDERTEREEYDTAESAEEAIESSSAEETEEHATTSASQPIQSLARIKDKRMRRLRSTRANITPLPPSPGPSIISPTSSTPAHTAPTIPPLPPYQPLIDEIVARHIVSNLQTFRAGAPWQQMLRDALQSLVRRGESEVFYAILDDARRGSGGVGERMEERDDEDGLAVTDGE